MRKRGRRRLPAAGLSGLIEGHLRPFVELCHARCGLAPRVLWGNAATILDYVAREIGEDAPFACDEVATCLGWRRGPGCARTPPRAGPVPGCGGLPAARVLPAPPSSRRGLLRAALPPRTLSRPMLKAFLAYYRPHKALFLVDFGCAVLSGLLELGFPWR